MISNFVGHFLLRMITRFAQQHCESFQKRDRLQRFAGVGVESAMGVEQTVGDLLAEGRQGSCTSVSVGRVSCIIRH